MNIVIRCKKDDEFNHIRNVNYSCGCTFSVTKDNVYSINSLDYFGDDMVEYYTICPFCGYINKLNADILPQEVKEDADFRCKTEPFLYRKNNLKSELIYLDRLSPPYVLKKTK